jgi:Nop53 (60S ribosomal biogenesis)
MGKRKLQGAKLRAQKRMKEQLEELQEQQAEEYTTQRWIDEHTTTTTTNTNCYGTKNDSKKNTTKGSTSSDRMEVEENANITTTTITSNNDLFMIDTVGEGGTKNRRSMENKGNDKKKESQHEQQQKPIIVQKVQQMIKNHTTQQLQQLVQDGRQRLGGGSNNNNKITTNKPFAQLLRPNRQIDYSTTPSNIINKNKKTLSTNVTKLDLWNDDTTSTSINGTNTVRSTKIGMKMSTSALITSSSITSNVQQQAKATVPDPGIGGSLAGISPGHCVVKAKTLAASIAIKKAKKEAKEMQTNSTAAAVTTSAAVSSSATVLNGTRISSKLKKNTDDGTMDVDDAATTTSTVVSKKKKKKKKNKKKTDISATAVTTTTVVTGLELVKRTSVAVDVAQSGQSYHPDPVAYQKLLHQAVQVEVLRTAATQQLIQPIAQGMSTETRALLLHDDSDSDDDDDDNNDSMNNDNDDDTNKLILLSKRNIKLTRAQRNKQKRVKQEMVIQQQRKKEKKMLKQVGNIHQITKELKQQQQKQQNDKNNNTTNTANQLLPGQNIEMKAFQYDPIAAPTIPIALIVPSPVQKDQQQQQGPSLRTLRPRGSLLTDRVQSYTDRNLIPRSKKMNKFNTIAGRTSMYDIEKNQHLLQQINTTTTINIVNRPISAISGSNAITTHQQQINHNNHTIKPIYNKKIKQKKKVVGLHNWNGPDYKILGC